MSALKRGVALGALAAVAACAKPAKQDDRICLTRPADRSGTDAGACIHTWSYRLAGAPGTGKQIADAVVAGCYDVIDAASSGFKDDRTGAPILASDIRRDLIAQFTRQALFEVTQARAGKCDVP